MLGTGQLVEQSEHTHEEHTMEKRLSLQQVVLGMLDSCMQINEVRTRPHTIHKNNSKWLKYLNIRNGTIKFLEENIGKTF